MKKKRPWTSDEVLALKRLCLDGPRYGALKAFAESIGRPRQEAYAKWKELRDKHAPCAAMLDDGPASLSYRERARTLLAEPAPPQKFLCGRGGL